MIKINMRKGSFMEEQVITVTIKTKGDTCVLSNEEIAKWYKDNIAKLFNKEFGTPEIEVDVKKIEH